MNPSGGSFTDDLFVEIFDLDSDPGQLVNLVNRTADADLRFYRDAVRKQFQCAGEDCA